MKRILLVCLTAVLAFASSVAWAQERTVTGRITSAEDGSGLPGVNVVLKGTTNGTVTDVNGSYTLKVPAEGGILMVTFIGLSTQEIEIGGRSTVDVAMAADTKQLTEVVVTAFGIEKDKKSLGYAVQDVAGSALTTARESNLVNSLSGRVAGVQITNGSGSVGASSRIVLRGASSLTGNNQPLFVVDGIPINNNNYGAEIGGTAPNGNGGADRQNGAADINPDDVESITVLPGPNAAALYGSRASNGVILITTKTGRGTKGLGISVNSSATFEKPLRLPSYQNSYGGGYNNKYYNWHDGTTDSGGEDESWGPALDKGLEFVQWDSPNGQPTPWVSRPDNIKDFFETGRTLQNNIALSGGTEKADFRLSLSHFDQKGILPNNGMEKYTLAVNTGLSITEKFRAEVSANYVKSNSDNITGGGYDNNNPMQQFTWFQRNVNVAGLKDYKNLPLAPVGTSAEGTPINWNTNYNNNPYWILDNNTQGFDRDRLIGNVRLSYEFTDWLSLAVRTGTDFFTDLATTRRAKGSNDYPNGAYQEIDRTWYEVNSDFLLTFNKEVMQDLKVVASVGGNKMRQVHDRTRAEAPELEIPGVYNLDNSRVAVDVETFSEQKEIHSLYGNVELSFRDYLFLTVTGRNDWSSTLPKANNSYFYPSFALSADVTSMLGLQSEILSYAKVRGGWAQVGADTDPYKLFNVYTTFDPWGGSLIEPTVANLLANPNLKPEISTSYEIGTELGLFGNLINLTATYYNKKSTDQIVPVTISGASGYTSIQLNAGEMENKGFEVSLSGTPVKTSSGFTWDVGVNYTRNRNTVVSLAPGLETLPLGSFWNAQVMAQRGQPYGVIYGTDYARDPQGNIIHVNGLPQRAAENRTLGNANPDWLGGLNNTFSFKGLSLNVLIDAKIGGEIYSMTNAWGRYSGILEETLIGRETGIIGKGVKPAGTDENGDPIYVPNDVTVTSMAYNHAAFGNSIVAGSVFDASYVKLRQVSLGYTLPASMLTKTPFKKVTFSIVGRNLALLHSNAPHIDPETGFSNSNAVLGLEHAQIPSTRSLGFNLNFTL